MFTIARKQLKKLKSGSVLSLVVLMSLVLSIVGISLMSLSSHARTRAVRTADELSARVAADAGLIRAISMMNKKLEQETVWDITDLPSIDEATLPGMNASYSFFVEEGDSGYRVISTGQTLMNTKTVYADLRLGGLYEYAVFGSEKIELKQGTSIDAYNFGEDNPFLRIGTNSTNYNAIDLKNGTTVNGDLITRGPVEIGDDIFFGLVEGHDKELGYFSLSELEGVTGPMGLPIERDLHWQPKTLKEIASELFHDD